MTHDFYYLDIPLVPNIVRPKKTENLMSIDTAQKTTHPTHYLSKQVQGAYQNKIITRNKNSSYNVLISP